MNKFEVHAFKINLIIIKLVVAALGVKAYLSYLLLIFDIFPWDSIQGNVVWQPQFEYFKLLWCKKLWTSIVKWA
jgi:hypothetical protein